MEQPIELAAVHGTDGWREPWWIDGSPWWQMMRGRGFVPATVGGQAFAWTGNLPIDSAIALPAWIPGTGRQADWVAGGLALLYFWVARGRRDLWAVAHSNGGQVCLHAAALGVVFARLVTIATPVRDDMRPVLERARPNIKRHVHVCDPDHDAIATLGALGDGDLRTTSRVFPIVNGQPEQTLQPRGIDHRRLVMNPDRFHLWTELGLVAFLRDAAQEAA